MQTRRRRGKIGGIVRRRKNDLIYAGVRTVFALAKLLPRHVGLAVFAALAQAASLCAPADRKRTARNLASVFGSSWPQARVRRLDRRVFRELGKNVFDTLYLTRCTRERFSEIVHHDSLEEFERAYGEGRGVIALVAHVGCFELLLHFVAMQGFKCFAIGRKLYDARVDTIVTGLRSGENIVYLYRDESARRVIGLLKEGRLMGALIDQDTKVDGVFAHFLGKLAHTPSGPMRLAMKYGIPVFVITTARQDDDSHHVYISRRLALDETGDMQRDLATNVEKANMLISEAIRRHPEQWVWMHERWRKQPDTPGCESLPNIEKYE